ncbi:MAG TPA: ATP-binding protein [Noviherbaspirillum sp.]|nr:ATP-binding protein [Noviherbaspirillum sp.]
MKGTAAERSIRDLMGLLALPALWAGQSGESIVRIMADAVERVVPLRFSLAHVACLPDYPPFVHLRVDGKVAHGDETSRWEELQQAWHDAQTTESHIFFAHTPLGEMRVVRFNLGYKGQGGSIWFGSPDPAFPTMTQVAFLRAATSLAATGIQAARSNHEREEANRAKDEFLAMLGHELRNPLAPIVTALELIKLKNGGVLAYEHSVIERQVSHLNRMVSDLLDISRITRGKVRLEKQALNLTDVLHRTVEEVAAVLSERRHELTLDLPSEAVWIFGDHTRLVQVFKNLLLNAAKYTEPGGTIRVRSEVQAQDVRVAIRDNGCGISPQLLPRLFNLFEQGHTTLARSSGGLGIGLALVKSFVEQHGGSVTASSEGIGHGAEFVVRLPLLTTDLPPLQPVDAHASGRERSLPSHAARVLIVDDNIDALDTLAYYLRTAGYDVTKTHDPLEAVAMARQWHPHAAIVDIGLPVMDGYTLAAELRRWLPPEQLRLVALTGYGQATDIRSSKAAGFDRHLVKPVKLDDLLSALEGGSQPNEE